MINLTWSHLPLMWDVQQQYMQTTWVSVTRFSRQKFPVQRSKFHFLTKMPIIFDWQKAQWENPVIPPNLCSVELWVSGANYSTVIFHFGCKQFKSKAISIISKKGNLSCYWWMPYFLHCTYASTIRSIYRMILS